MKGTYQSEEYGTTSGIKVRDRCEECRGVFAETDVTLESASLNEQICLLFVDLERRDIKDDDFVNGIQKLFAFAGGWIISPQQKTG